MSEGEELSRRANRALKLQKQMDAVAEFAANPNHIPPEGSLFDPKSKVGSNKRIEVDIYDSSQKDGKIHDPYNQKALLQGLFEMMYCDLMSDADISPKYDWCKWVNGSLRLAAIGESSAEYLRDIVERMPPPWRGAQPWVDFRSPKRVVVEAYVPGDMVLIQETLTKISEFDPRIRTDLWQCIGGRPHADGYVYTFTIQQGDFAQLDKYNGFIPYNGTQIEFRVINNDNSMENAM